MISSIQKILKYMSCTSIADTVIQCEGETITFPKNTEIKLCESLWHKDYCNYCGQCCRNYNTIFSEEEFKTVVAMSEYSEPHADCIKLADHRVMFVNGEGCYYYDIPAMNNKDSHGILVNTGTCLNCRWIDVQPDGRKFCKIHEYRTITCGFPHLEFRQTGNNRPSLMHIQFGRNHQLGCKVDIKLPEYDKATYDDDIYWLTRLDNFAQEYNIPTLLPKILDFYHRVDWKNPPRGDVIIDNRKHLF